RLATAEHVGAEGNRILRRRARQQPRQEVERGLCLPRRAGHVGCRPGECLEHLAGGEESQVAHRAALEGQLLSRMMPPLASRMAEAFRLVSGASVLRIDVFISIEAGVIVIVLPPTLSTSFTPASIRISWPTVMVWFWPTSIV